MKSILRVSTQSNTELNESISIRVSPKKDKPYYDYDIGILQMDRAVSFDNDIQPICLPQSPYVDYSGKLATAMGIYDTETIEVLFTRSKAQIFQIPILRTEQCAEVPEYVEKFTYNMLCAGDDPEDGIRRPYFRDVRSIYKEVVIIIFSIQSFLVLHSSTLGN